MKHDLMSNYHSADGADDDKMKLDILTSEVGKMIVKYPERIIENMEAEKFKVPPSLKRKPKGRFAQRKLVNLTTNAIYKSKSFAKRISEDIVSGNYSFCGDAKSCNFCCASDSCAFSQDGGSEVDKVDKWTKAIGGVSELVKGLGDLFGGGKKAQAEAEKAKAEAERALYEKTKALSGEKKKTTPIGLYIGIAVAVVLGIGAIVLIAKRRQV